MILNEEFYSLCVSLCILRVLSRFASESSSSVLFSWFLQDSFHPVDPLISLYARLANGPLYLVCIVPRLVLMTVRPFLCP